MTRGVVTLMKKDPNKGDDIRNLNPITLLNIVLKIQTKVLAKRLTRFVGLLSGKRILALYGAGSCTTVSFLELLDQKFCERRGIGAFR